MPNDISEKLQRKLDDGREFRDMEIRAEGETTDEMVVEGYATTFDEPYLLWSEPGFRVFEKVDRDAFAGTDMTDVIMQYDHEGRVFARLSNNTLALHTDDHGLHVRALLSGTELGRQLYQEIKGGYTNKMSFAFTVAEDARDIQENKDTNETTITRTIKRIGKLYDVSAVSLPANPATAIAARTYGEGVIAEAKAERQRAAEEKEHIERLKAKIRILAMSE